MEPACYTGVPLYLDAAAESLGDRDPAAIEDARRLEPLRRLSALLNRAVAGMQESPPAPPEAVAAWLDQADHHLRTLALALAAGVLARNHVAAARGLPGHEWPLTARPPEDAEMPPARSYRRPVPCRSEP